MTAPEWRDCADPDELAAAVAAGVEVLRMRGGGWVPSALTHRDDFAWFLTHGTRYQLPASWTWRPEPPAPDDLAARARRHADTHPESRELIEGLLGAWGQLADRAAEAQAAAWDQRLNWTGKWPTPPDGCEVVWLPSDVVDEWVGLPTTDYPPSLGQARATIYACREAQARRGTIPTPEWLTPEVVGRIEDAMLNGDTEDPPPTRTPSSLGDAMRLIGRYTESEGGDSPETTNARRGLFSGYDAWVGAGRPESTTPPPVPPWPGAVLSGLTDEDGVPTWLAQAGQVRGEQVRACTSVPWLPNTSYGEDEWVEVRAPRAMPEPERVSAVSALADGLMVNDGNGDFFCPSYARRNTDDSISLVREDGYQAALVAPDGTVEVLKDGEQ